MSLCAVGDFGDFSPLLIYFIQKRSLQEMEAPLIPKPIRAKEERNSLPSTYLKLSPDTAVLTLLVNPPPPVPPTSPCPTLSTYAELSPQLRTLPEVTSEAENFISMCL